MNDPNSQLIETWKRTRSAFMWTRVLNTPFWAIYNMLPYIIYKDLHATPLQITTIIILKPTVSLIALYWGALVEKRKDRLIANIVWGRILGHIPFFFFPFINNPWFFIFAFGFYMMLSRGSEPAWMEILKLNIPNASRERTFAYGSAAGYLGTATLPFALGGLMDSYADAWRWIFVVAALISTAAIFCKWKIPIQLDNPPSQKSHPPPPRTSLINLLVTPWKSAFKLVAKYPNFRHYQLGFMLGGGGLIIMQPALPVFFMDNLKLTYTELAVALTLFKGIGFAITSPAWAKLIQKFNIYDFNGVVTFFAVLFPLCLIGAQYDLIWLYSGYLLYGIMQAGSEMSWSLSGPIFAKNEDSSAYSNVNILAVGLRGCFFPIVGTTLMYSIHATGVMFIGAALSFLSTMCMKYYGNKHFPHADTAVDKKSSA